MNMDGLHKIGELIKKHPMTFGIGAVAVIALVALKSGSSGSSGSASASGDILSSSVPFNSGTSSGTSSGSANTSGVTASDLAYTASTITDAVSQATASSLNNYQAVQDTKIGQMADAVTSSNATNNTAFATLTAKFEALNTQLHDYQSSAISSKVSSSATAPSVTYGSSSGSSSSGSSSSGSATNIASSQGYSSLQSANSSRNAIISDNTASAGQKVSAADSTYM
jgi:hypothetical protein